MKLTEVKLTGTCSTGGALTVNATRAIFGKLFAVEWVDGTLDNSSTATLTVQGAPSTVAQTLLTLSGSGADEDKWYYPRTTVHDSTGGVVTYDATREVKGKAIINGKLRLVIASGGNAKTGGCYVYIEENDS